MCVEFDGNGRMKYNSELHFNQGQPWVTEDVEYLIEWLDKIGYEEMSLALGRTEATLRDKVFKLRKKGLMKKSSDPVRRIRLLRRCECEQAINY